MKSQLDKVDEGRMAALKIQANLANQLEIDNNNLLREVKYNIAPVPVMDKMTPQEKLQDNTLQLQLLRKALKDIMVDGEIWKYTTKYVGNNAGFVNTHLEEMKQLLKGRKYITADFFRNFVVAFQKNYMETRTITEKLPNDPTYDANNILDVGIEIPNLTLGAKAKLVDNITKAVRETQMLPEVREIMNNTYLDTFDRPHDLKAELARQITEYNDDPVKIRRILNAVKNAENIAINDSNLINLYITQIDRINGMEQKKLINTDEAKRYERVVQQQIRAIVSGEININDFQEPQTTRAVEREPDVPFQVLTTDTLTQIVNGNEMVFQDYLETIGSILLSAEGIERAIKDYRTRDTDEKMAKYLRTLIGNIYEKAINNYIDENRPLLTNEDLTNFVKEKKLIINRFKAGATKANINRKLEQLNTNLQQLVEEIDYASMNSDVKILFERDGQGLYGHGMIQKHLKSRRVRIGGGIERQERPLYQKLGRYIIHIPSLTKNVLNVKYPSMVSIKSLPKRPISTMMKNLLFEMLDNGDFNKKYYNVLDEDEQDLIRDVLYQAEIGEKFGFGLKDTPYSNIIDRFNLLKSQVIAGNNNKEVITELKQLTSKLVDKSVLNKGDGFELLKLIDAI